MRPKLDNSANGRDEYTVAWHKGSHLNSTKDGYTVAEKGDLINALKFWDILYFVIFKWLPAHADGGDEL
jgi:hypothetical protein